MGTLKSLISKFSGAKHDAAVDRREIGTVGKVPLLRHMSTEGVLKTLAVAEERKFEKEENIILEGEPGDTLYIIKEGSVIVTKKADGHEEVLTSLEAGECFGEMALIDDSPRSASVTALEPCVLLAITRENLGKLIADETELALTIFHNFAVMLAVRLRRTSDRLHDLVNDAETVKGSVDSMTSEILSVMSHEVRTPTTLIQVSAEMLDGKHLSPEVQRKLIVNIDQHAQKLGKLMNDIIQLAQSRYIDQQLEKKSCDVDVLLQEVASDLAPDAEKFKVEVKVSAMSSLPPLSCDRNKMKKALEHLIDNGIKFNKPGGKLDISARLTTGDGKPLLEIRILDQGPGIPKDRIEELSTSLHQQKPPLDPERISGLGVGLPLARNIVKVHGGDLIIESPQGGGCLARIMMPLG